jgi:ABC-type dipeptide/oligopeptide/nickel transport system ATPase subunit
MTSEPAILTHGLTKSYGHDDAVRGLDLSIGRNRITAFLGRNGAGKSTTIKMLLGLIRPTSGSGTVLGKQITDAEQNRRMRQRVAYVAEDKSLYGYMTVQQTINFARSFYSDWHVDAEKKLLLDSELPANRKVKSLSKGMRTSSPCCWRLPAAQNFSSWMSRVKDSTLLASKTYCERSYRAPPMVFLSSSHLTRLLKSNALPIISVSSIRVVS